MTLHTRWPQYKILNFQEHNQTQHFLHDYKVTPNFPDVQLQTTSIQYV